MTQKRRLLVSECLQVVEKVPDSEVEEVVLINKKPTIRNEELGSNKIRKDMQIQEHPTT